MKRAIWALFVLSAIWPVGCGKSESAPQQTAAPTPPEPRAVQPDQNLPAVQVTQETPLSTSTAHDQPPTFQPRRSVPPVAASAEPQEVVVAFLESLQAGDKTRAADLLTDRARQETAKKGMDVDPRGSESAQYQVGAVEYVTESKDGAHVSSVWIEADEDGASESYEIIWVLRQQANGWRIAGMATQVADGKLPIFLNFEDPEDMLRKWQEADAELSRAQESEAGVQQARTPETPPGNALRQ